MPVEAMGLCARSGEDDEEHNLVAPRWSDNADPIAHVGHGGLVQLIRQRRVAVGACFALAAVVLVLIAHDAIGVRGARKDPSALAAIDAGRIVGMDAAAVQKVWYRTVENAQVREHEALDSRELSWSPLLYGRRALILQRKGRRAKVQTEIDGNKQVGWVSLYTADNVQIMQQIPSQQDPGHNDQVFEDIGDAREELRKNMQTLMKKMGVFRGGKVDLSKDSINSVVHDKEKELEGYIGRAKTKAHVDDDDMKKAKGGMNKILHAVEGTGLEEEAKQLKEKGETAANNVKRAVHAKAEVSESESIRVERMKRDMKQAAEHVEAVSDEDESAGN